MFPTPIPVASPEPTPRLTGACSLLREIDVEEVVGADVQQASATPLSCGFAHGRITIALTLQRAASWEPLIESFEAEGPVEQVPGLGDRAVYAAGSLGGVLMMAMEPELYLLSGTGTREVGERLMNRVLERFAEAEAAATAESID